MDAILILTLIGVSFLVITTVIAFVVAVVCSFFKK